MCIYKINIDGKEARVCDHTTSDLRDWLRIDLWDESGGAGECGETDDAADEQVRIELEIRARGLTTAV